MGRCRTGILAWMLVTMQALASCAVTSAQVPEENVSECRTSSGALANTLYVSEQLADAAPPVPQLPHLAPYPPAAGGEHRIHFRGSTYIASGMPVRATNSVASDYKIVKLGSAGSVPVFARGDTTRSEHTVPRIWAPITDSCIFLPFNHESEIR
jgi:hypothetical protein